MWNREPRHVIGADPDPGARWARGERFAPGTGLGAWRHCPCSAASADHAATYSYAFHDGGDVRVMYFPTSGDVVVGRFSKSLYTAPPLANELDGFAYQAIARLG